MSDHRHIRFDIEATITNLEEFRIPRQTDWALYKEGLRSETEGYTNSIETVEELEEACNQIQSLIKTNYERNCPAKQKAIVKDVPWWNRELSRLKAETRKMFNRAKSSGNWEDYRKALTEYNKELRRSKRKSWRKFCEGIEELPAAVRLQRVLSKDHSNGIGLLKKPNGNYTGSQKENITVLLETHFPGSQTIEGETPQANLAEGSHRPTRSGKSLAGRIFTANKIKWAINSFKPFKAPGRDGIFPALLQQGIEELTPHLRSIYKASFTLGYIPQAWREVKVTFIPKLGRRQPEEPKSYRPISLTSFLLKTMEKLIDEYLRSDILIRTPIYSKQFAYQTGKSTINALDCLVTSIEKTFVAKEVALSAFIDIEGAFDNTSYESIQRAAERKGIDPTTTTWIQSMLKKRKITATIGNDSATVSTVKGCPQGGVLSPLLWSLVVDDLLVKLSNSGFNVQGYADDLVVTIRGKHETVLSNLLQIALKIISNWCLAEGLSVNPSKTVIVPFTKRRKLKLKAPVMNGIRIEYSGEVKYLGVILDKKLTWNAHIDRVLKKATAAIWTCQRLFGKTWGLKPKMIYWSYLTVVRPMVTYASFVWWPKTKQRSAQDKLQKLQRLACLGITGAMRSCPTAAMEVMLNLLPLHLSIRKEAAYSATRLQQANKLKPGNLVGHLRILEEIQIKSVSQPTDIMPAKRDFNRPFDVVIGDRLERGVETLQLPKGSLVWYTDGSKMDEGVGVGIAGPNCRIHRALGKTPTIFQAEIFAIDVCTQECIGKGMRGARIYILSDSQAALKALQSYTIESKIVWDCKQSLKQLATNNKVTLKWVPGHEGIQGNEMADRLAKEGARAPFYGPEPFCGLAKSHMAEEFRKWEKEQMSSYWRNTPGQRQAKRFISHSPKKSKELLELGKSELRLVTGLLTGHCPLRYHLKNMGKAETDSCRFCDSAKETAEHILCNCKVLIRTRLKYLEQVELTPGEVGKVAPRKLTNFIRSLAILGWK